MSKIDVISGFLGAGKTTLISKLLKDVFAGKKTALVENEFGEIGIDGGFLKDAGIEIKEINSGCICCTLKGDFQTALKMVEDTYHPEHILIEPSGVGKLSDILLAVKKVEGTELSSYSTVVDAERCGIYHKNFKEFFDDQISTAACVILSRTQDVTDEKLKEDTDIIYELNPNARIITTPWNRLNGKSIYEAMTGSTNGFPENLKEDPEEEEDDDDHDEHEEHEDHDHEHHHHHHHDGEHDADEVFDSIGLETIHHYSEQELRTDLQSLGSNVIRAKGIVQNQDNDWLFFDYVPGSIDIRKGSPAYTGLITVIGEHVDRDETKRLFGVQ